ncbi:MAG: AAA family ATPase, partial [Methyloprofundus sp.]|nr:AAA family ATPase [Methyloprofundus sp.]
QASALWDGISLTELEKEVLVGIKLIEPNATGLTFVDSGRQGQLSQRIALVKLSNMDEPIPLKSLGDGMTRIFHLILALVSAKDGVLIIDEFENGLHWSTQKAVWTIIFHLATRLNVQVFCSTHSRDCISGFEQVWTENKQSAGFIRVMKEEGIAKIREYDLELLSDSLETDVEVR